MNLIRLLIWLHQQRQQRCALQQAVLGKLFADQTSADTAKRRLREVIRRDREETQPMRLAAMTMRKHVFADLSLLVSESYFRSGRFTTACARSGLLHTPPRGYWMIVGRCYTPGHFLVRPVYRWRWL